MKKLLLATATLIALAVPATAMTLVDQVNAVALLAEYVTTCGGRAKPIVEREAVRIVEHIGFKNWYSMASWVHLERDEAVQKQFCLDAAIRSAPMLAASHLTTGKSPIAAELDLSELTRRLAGPPWCVLPYRGLIASANKQACDR
jgi:hypothetical protein